MIDSGHTWAAAIEATGVSNSAIWRARAKLQQDAPAAPDPVELNWELWRRKLEPERSPGSEQVFRRFYLVKRFETRAQINKAVDAELRGKMYVPSDLHIANPVIGIPRPPDKSRARKQAPVLPRMPWALPRATPEAAELKRRLKAATFKPPKPLRTVVVDGTVVELPTGVDRAVDMGMKGQVYSSRWTWRKAGKRGCFTDSKYGGALAALDACKAHLAKLNGGK